VRLPLIFPQHRPTADPNARRGRAAVPAMRVPGPERDVENERSAGQARGQTRDAPGAGRTRMNDPGESRTSR
jgi:hypothetical protein